MEQQAHMTLEQVRNRRSFISTLTESINRSREGVSPRQGNSRICKVVPTIRNTRPRDYEPTVISIGPYHHGKEHLKDMEEFKLLILNDFINRNPSRTVANYISRITEKEKEIRSCYADGLRNLDSETVVRIITIDGCFLVELMIQVSGNTSSSSCTAANILRWDDIARDLYLLENQIPFFVLDEIWKVLGWELAVKFEDTIHLDFPNEIGDIRLIKPFLLFTIVNYSLEIPNLPQDYRLLITRQPFHLLDLLHFVMFPKYTPPSDFSHNMLDIRPLPCTSELASKGIKFIKGDHFTDSALLSFDNGTIRLPTFNVHHMIPPILRNVIAYEQSVQDVGFKVSTFARHMDDRINTADDVAILRRRGILNCELGSDEEVANFFNEINTGVFCQRANMVCSDIRKFYDSKRVAWMAELKHEYFGSPWKATAVLAAASLLFLTFTQTLFTVLSYTYHKD